MSQRQRSYKATITTPSPEQIVTVPVSQSSLREICELAEPLPSTSFAHLSLNAVVSQSTAKSDDSDKPKPPPSPPEPKPPAPAPPNPPPDEESCTVGSDEDFQKEVENSDEIKKICEQLIAKIPDDACGTHPPKHKKEIIKINSKCPPRKATIRHRLPSPEPDVIERVTIVKPAQDIINIIIEKPSMPPACMVERIEHEAPLSPLICHNVVCVLPSSKLPPGTKLYEALPEQQTTLSPAASTEPLKQEESPFLLAFTPFQHLPTSSMIEVPVQINSRIRRPSQTASKTTDDSSKIVESTPKFNISGEPENKFYNWPHTSLKHWF